MKPADTSIRVMLIDDHQTLLWGLDKLIQGQNPRMEVVGCARSCEEAVEKIDKLTPDVILLDLDLGGKCGLDILPALLSNSVSRVIILTGGRDQATLDLAVLRGVRGVLHKDAPAEQVLKAIEKVHLGELWLAHGQLGRMLGEIMHPMKTGAIDPEKEKKTSLTARERKIIQTIVSESGAPNKLIAQRLFISEHTLRNHLTSIYHKLNVLNRLELYVYAVKHQMATPLPECKPSYSGNSEAVQTNL